MSKNKKKGKNNGKTTKKPRSLVKLNHDLSIFNNRVFFKKYPGADSSDLEMCFSPKALKTLLETVGMNEPETGAKGFSAVISDDPDENTVRIGFDIIEYDKIGSHNATGSMYSPNLEWSTKRVNYHMDAEDFRFWVGDIHSHPGNLGTPSPDWGDGRGDLGYVRKIFETYPFPLDFFLLPIITLEGGKIIIHPWIIERKNPTKPLIAEVRVCNPFDFPEVEESDTVAHLEATIDGMYDLFKVQSDRIDEKDKLIKNLGKRIEQLEKLVYDRKDPRNPLIAKNVKVCSASDFPIIDLDTSSLEPTIDAMYKLSTDLSDRFDALEESMKKEIKNLSEEIDKLRKTNQNPLNHTLDILNLALPLPFPWGEFKMTCLGTFNISQETTAAVRPATSTEEESKQMEVL